MSNMVENVYNKISVFNNIFNKIHEKEKVAIYGAGEHTINLIASTILKDKNIINIIDKNSNEKFILNIEVIRPDLIKQIKPDVIVISSFRYQEEIYDFLINNLDYKVQIIKLYDKNDSYPFYINSEIYNRIINNIRINEIIERPCHYYELFINHNGEIFPCCRVWNNTDLKIGHINDLDLLDKISNYDKRCSCGSYILRNGTENDKRYYALNLELSLVCQAKCAMCCVNAPEWEGTFNCYDQLSKIIELLNPKYISVQGGEILIQKKSIEWLKYIKEKYPNIELHLVTNGNAEECMAETVKELFDKITISIVGFQSETYRKIMMIDINKTMKFAESLIKNNARYVCLKYLVTPLNAHESNLFLKWAISINAKNICFIDANTSQYINLDTSDNYWNKIFERTGEDIKKELILNYEKIIGNKTYISFNTEWIKYFNIDNKFILNNGLSNNVGVGY